MKKKNITTLLLLIVITLGLVFGISKLTPKPIVDDNQKTINIKIEDRTKDPIVVLEEKSFKTDKQFLSELLIDNKKDLQLVYEDSQYGMLIYGLYNLNTEDINVGPWWMFDVNGEVGMLGASQQPLADNDQYTFYFMAY